jgi:TonB family protein
MKYRVVFFIAWLCVAAVAAPAKGKGPSADDVLKKGLDSTDVWSHGPLMITAKVRFLNMHSGVVDMDYTLYWESPDRWRAGWQGGGISDVHAANVGQTWSKSNIQVPSLRMLQFNDAMRELTSGFLPSPFGTVAPSNDATKYTVRDRKIDGIPAYCLQGEAVGTCFTAENGTLLRYNGNLGLAYYSEYVAFEGKWFPSSIKIRNNGNTVLEAKLEIKPWPVDATLWRVPAGAVASQFPQCADAKAPATGGKVINRQQPEYPAIATRTRQQGQVAFYAKIGKDGRINNLVQLESAGPNIDQAAYEAVRNWTYEPTLKCGVPIEVEVPITVNFSLSR